MIWGRTSVERFEKWRARRDADEQWHEWYAWRPVILNDGRWTWLQPVWRKLHTSYYGDAYWHYSTEREQ